MLRIPRKIRKSLHLAALLAAATVCGAPEIPTDILFLRGNLEISFGKPAPLDQTLVAKLENAGFRVHTERDFQPLTMEYLRQFHAIVWVGISPAYAEGRLYSPVNWQGGLRLLTVRENARLLKQYADEGGGLLLNPGADEMGMQIVPSHKRILNEYDMDISPAQVRDPTRQFVFHKVLKRYPYAIAWTERIGQHPATEGVRRIYYPAYTMRWDDNFTTLPLYPRDTSWIRLVSGDEKSRVSWYRGTPYEYGHWKDDPDAETPATIAAARPFGKGRVAVVSIGHYHLFYFPYSDAGNFWEVNFGPQKGILMTEGDGETPSDLERMMFQLFGWLSESGRKAGFGFDPDSPAPLPKETPPTHENIADVWADDDPLTSGPVRPMRILVGARTAYSDGRGTPADYAAAAKDAGYDVVAFTETFEAMSRQGFREFVESCRKHSDDEVFLLPGIDVADSLGNRFLLLGKDTPIRDHLLVEKEEDSPGDTLIWTGHMLIGMGEVLPVAARPQRMATPRKHGTLPPELYSHFAGVAVSTYRDGKQVDDGLFAYQWHVFNASIPIPVAVHEVYGPEEVALAASTGLQTLVNGDHPRRVADYFRQGHMSFGGNPMRTYLSDGPLADAFGIDDWQAQPWRISLKISDKEPIEEIRVSDQRGSYRRFLPGKNTAEVFWHGDLGAQHWFYVEARNASGGRMILSPLRTLPRGRAFVRCMDRQNWFSGLHFSIGVNYTGRRRRLPDPGITFAVPGSSLPDAPLAPKLHLTYNGNGLTVVDYVVDGTQVPGGRNPGADASPIFNHLPIEEFTARFRNLYYMAPRGSRPEFFVTENSVTLNRDTMPQGTVWPILHKAGTPTFRYWDRGETEWVAGIVEKDKPPRSLPAGTLVGGNQVILDPAYLSASGALGPAVTEPGRPVASGTRYVLRFTGIAKDQTEEAMSMMGFAGNPPYGFELSRGAFDGGSHALRFRAENGGVAGKIRGVKEAGRITAFPGKNGLMPAELREGNPRWPLGVWMADEDVLTPYQYLDGIGRGRIPVHRDADFYFGSLIVADDHRLALQFAEPWTADRVVIEAHNPTDETIKTAVRTAPEIASRKKLEWDVTVAPGSTVLIGDL